MNSVNTTLRDRILLRTHYLARFETSQVKDLLKTLESAHKSIINKLRMAPDIVEKGDAFNRSQLEDMLKEIDAIYAETFKAFSGQLELGLKDLSGSETAWAVSNLEKTIPLKVDILTPSPSQVWAAVTTSPMDRGHLLSELIQGLERGTQDKVKAAIRQGVVEGETIDQIALRLQGTKLLKGKDGVMQSSRAATEAVVRTGVMHVSNVARGQVNAENADIIDGEQFVATLDTATCAECGAEDGKVYPLGEGPIPPLHLNCRCVRSAVVKSWKDLGFNIDEVPPGTRASMDGQVPDSLTYGEWLKTQSTEIQDAALGPGRAQLFRDGANMSRFVADGRVLTLDEIPPF